MTPGKGKQLNIQKPAVQKDCRFLFWNLLLPLLDLGEDRLEEDEEAQQNGSDDIGPGGHQFTVEFNQRGNGAVDQNTEQSTDDVAHTAGQ